MAKQQSGQRGRDRASGRPRSMHVHQTILESTRSLLAEVGYEHLSIESVAADAGVGKSTIYRRWSTKEDLVVDALVSAKPTVAVPDTGDLRQDIHAWVETYMAVMGSSVGRQVLGLIIGTVSSNPHLAEVYWSRYVVPANDALAAVLQRAQARGQLRADTPLSAAIDAVSGIMFYQLLVKPSAQVSLQHIHQAIDIVLRGSGVYDP
jgi:AcrR family transcriptional regulator